jgi:hypothetical protein
MDWKILLNRWRNHIALTDLEQSPPQEEERSGDAQQDAKTNDHKEAVRQRLRDLAAFERRAKGKDVA